MSASVSDASRQDVPQILEIVNHYILHDTCIYDWEPRSLEFQTQWFDQQIALGNPVLVVKDTNRVIGFASYAQFRPKIGYKFSMEHSVYVHPECQGKGIGKSLLLTLMERAKISGVHLLIGGIDAQNESSIQFHQSLGFEITGRMNQVGYKFDRWLDLVWVQKIM